MITSITKGSYGQWIVTAEVNGCFVSKQYYGYLKRETKAMALQDIKEGVFDRI